MTELKQIKRLPFVAKAYTRDGVLHVETKPDILSTQITCSIRAYKNNPDEFTKAKALKNPILVRLPGYHIKFLEYGVQIKLSKYPANSQDYIKAFPQQIGTMSSRYWNEYSGPCLGDETKAMYVHAKSIMEQVMIITEYLQTALPDFGGAYKKTIFAYTMGLVDASEVLLKPTESMPQQQAVVFRNTLELGEFMQIIRSQGI